MHTLGSLRAHSCINGKEESEECDRRPRLTCSRGLLQIRLGMRYLRDVLKLRFPELRARAAAAAAAVAEREVPPVAHGPGTGLSSPDALT